jgi:hypothetical protein
MERVSIGHSLPPTRDGDTRVPPVAGNLTQTSEQHRQALQTDR